MNVTNPNVEAEGYKDKQAELAKLPMHSQVCDCLPPAAQMLCHQQMMNVFARSHPVTVPWLAGVCGRRQHMSNASDVKAAAAAVILWPVGSAEVDNAHAVACI